MRDRVTYLALLTLSVFIFTSSVIGFTTSCDNISKTSLIETSKTESQPTETQSVETTPEVTATEEISTTTTDGETTSEEATSSEETTTTIKENKSTTKATKATAKPTTKTTAKSTAKETAKSTTKSTTKSTSKSTTKATAKETTKATTKTATPVPSKGYAMIKVKVTSNVYVDDESDETEKKVDYFEIKCVTSKWHSKSVSDYKACDKNAVDTKLHKKYGDNLSNYSAKFVEVVKFVDN